MGSSSTSGNMKIRWYQHSTQGGSSSTSLKNSAPSVDAVAMTQAAKTSAQATSVAGGFEFIGLRLSVRGWDESIRTCPTVSGFLDGG